MGCLLSQEGHINDNLPVSPPRPQARAWRPDPKSRQNLNIAHSPPVSKGPDVWLRVSKCVFAGLDFLVVSLGFRVAETAAPAWTGHPHTCSGNRCPRSRKVSPGHQTPTGAENTRRQGQGSGAGRARTSTTSGVPFGDSARCG